MTPTPQRSDCGVNSPIKDSGAMYPGVPTMMVDFGVMGDQLRHVSKSINFTVLSGECVDIGSFVNIMFSGLMSLCTMPDSCRVDKPLRISRIILLHSDSGTSVS